MSSPIKFENGNRRVTVEHNKNFGEWIAKLYVAGKHYEPADYFTDDREDAIDTAKEMLRDPAEVRRVANLIADRVDGFDRDDLGESPDF